MVFLYQKIAEKQDLVLLDNNVMFDMFIAILITTLIVAIFVFGSLIGAIFLPIMFTGILLFVILQIVKEHRGR